MPTTATKPVLATRRGHAVEMLFAEMLVALDFLYGIKAVGAMRGEVIVADYRTTDRAWWLITDNGGELNVIKINGRVWRGVTAGESVAYAHDGALTDGATLAYRVIQRIDGDVIDYSHRDTDLVEIVRESLNQPAEG